MPPDERQIADYVAEGPLLGLATTAQLIEEIAVRMEITQHPRTMLGDGFGSLCRDMLRNFLPEVLDYRTVDSDG